MIVKIENKNWREQHGRSTFSKAAIAIIAKEAKIKKASEEMG